MIDMTGKGGKLMADIIIWRDIMQNDSETRVVNRPCHNGVFFGTVSGKVSVSWQASLSGFFPILAVIVPVPGEGV